MEASKIRELCDRVLELSGAEETEVTYFEVATALTRFANNQIEQNVSEVVANIMVRGHWGKKIARVTGSRFDDDSLRRLMTKAAEIATVQKDSPDLQPLAESQTYQPTDHFCELTASASPDERARGVREHILPVSAKGLTASGIYSTGYQTVAIANSRGLWAHDRFSTGSFSTQVMGAQGAGFAVQTSPSIKRVDIATLTDRAMGKCLGSENPANLQPGEYTVILEPSAVSNLLMFCGMLAFNAQAHIEGRTPFAGKVGEKVFGDNITIRDNAFHELATGVPFDFEGMPRQNTTLIDRGVLASLVHDRSTAAKTETTSTGHALPQPNPNGPVPLNLCLEPGEQTPEEIIAATPKGILVTQFHYTNLVNPMELSITGMTRNGTFMVENGRITGAVKNMRFTESVIKAFSNVTAVGSDLTLASSTFGGGYLVPTLRIEKFNFSSATEF